MAALQLPNIKYVKSILADKLQNIAYTPKADRVKNVKVSN